MTKVLLRPKTSPMRPPGDEHDGERRRGDPGDGSWPPGGHDGVVDEIHEGRDQQGEQGGPAPAQVRRRWWREVLMAWLTLQYVRLGFPGEVFLVES